MSDIKALLQAMANEHMIELRYFYDEECICEGFEVRMKGATDSEPVMFLNTRNNELEHILIFNSYDGSRIKEV